MAIFSLFIAIYATYCIYQIVPSWPRSNWFSDIFSALMKIYSVKKITPITFMFKFAHMIKKLKEIQYWLYWLIKHCSNNFCQNAESNIVGNSWILIGKYKCEGLFVVFYFRWESVLQKHRFLNSRFTWNGYNKYML